MTQQEKDRARSEARLEWFDVAQQISCIEARLNSYVEGALALLALLAGSPNVELSEDGEHLIVEGLTLLPEEIRKGYDIRIPSGTFACPTAPEIAKLRTERSAAIERLRFCPGAPSGPFPPLCRR